MFHENALAIATATATDRSTFPVDSVAAVGATFTYENELGSTMTFTVGAGGELSGTYTSAVSGGGGPVSGPMAGFIDSHSIAWSVSWPNAPAVTSWTGAFISNGTGFNIETLWYMATQASTSGAPFWTAVQAGADTFTPTP
jgi:hypothetical protein